MIVTRELGFLGQRPIIDFFFLIIEKIEDLQRIFTVNVV